MSRHQTTLPQISDAGAFASLEYYGLIRVSGADARSFLQAQLTTDLRELSVQRSQFSAWCNAKGRVQAVFRLFEREDSIVLRLPQNLVPLTLPRLKMFVLRAKVALDDISPSWAGLGLSGTQAAKQLAALLGQIPEAVNAVVQADGFAAMRVPGELPRFEIFGTPPALASLRDRLQAAGCPMTSSDVWRWRNLVAGLPEIHPQTREAFTPQMLNLDLLGAVSFKKGCYPGQEVVAKTHYRSLVKRRLYLATGDWASPPVPGTRVLTAAGEHAGDVVEAISGPEGKCYMSAVLMTEHAGVTQLQPQNTDAALRLLPLPYPVS